MLRITLKGIALFAQALLALHLLNGDSGSMLIAVAHGGFLRMRVVEAVVGIVGFNQPPSSGGAGGG